LIDGATPKLLGSHARNNRGGGFASSLVGLRPADRLIRARRPRCCASRVPPELSSSRGPNYGCRLLGAGDSKSLAGGDSRGKPRPARWHGRRRVRMEASGQQKVGVRSTDGGRSVSRWWASGQQAVGVGTTDGGRSVNRRQASGQQTVGVRSTDGRRSVSRRWAFGQQTAGVGSAEGGRSVSRRWAFGQKICRIGGLK
jgi:hypothetical protein